MGWGIRAAAAVLTVAALAACSTAQPPTGTKSETKAEPSAPVRQTVAEPPPVDPEWPRWGITHTQVSGNNGGERLQNAVSQTLSKVPMLQNQHIMGFGVGNPEIRPGEIDLSDLDSRVRLMDRSGGLPVITLCCAPDWMKGGPAGETSWTKEHFEAAPEPEHFDDFAKLAAAVAQRYDNVQYFMVWNELKGFWVDPKDPPDIKGYTELYNKVYDAVKAVRPDAKLGGPYLGFSSVDDTSASALKGKWGAVDQRVLDAYDYWFKHKKGADFVVVDGASPTEDHQLKPDAFGATAKFGAVTTWLRKHSGGLPVWWSEFYFVPEDGRTRWAEPKRLAVQATSMIEFAASGAATALYWNPEVKQGECQACMWDPVSGAPLGVADLIGQFVQSFPAGAKLEAVTTSDAKIRVLASDKRMVMVNTTDKERSAKVAGQDVTLGPYEIKWADR